MQSNELEKLFGRNRVKKYKSLNQEWLYLYEKNIDISESFYRKLFIFETFLRNRIDIEFTKEFGESWLALQSTKLDFKIKEILKIKEVCTRNNNKNLTHNQILENLTFGFWVGIFHGYYNRQIWGKKNCNMMARIFPHLTEKQRAFKKVSKDIDTIRKFRNKIFHFADVLNANYEEIDILIQKYTKGIYNGKEFIIGR